MSNTIHMRFVLDGKITGHGEVSLISSASSALKTIFWVAFKTGNKENDLAVRSYPFPADTIELGIKRPDGEVWYEGDLIECIHKTSGAIDRGTLKRTRDGVIFYINTPHTLIDFQDRYTMHRIGNIHEKEE